MTHEEKTVAKLMNRTIFDLIREKAAHLAVLKQCVANWQAEVEAANASEPLQAFARNVENARQGIDLLIDENNLTALPSRLTRLGLVN